MKEVSLSFGRVVFFCSDGTCSIRNGWSDQVDLDKEDAVILAKAILAEYEDDGVFKEDELDEPTMMCSTSSRER